MQKNDQGRDVENHRHTDKTEPHAVTRARERYGVDLSANDLDAIATDIRAGRSVLLARNGRYEEHIVRIRSVVLLLVIDRTDGTVITALPPSAKRPRHPRSPKARLQFPA